MRRVIVIALSTVAMGAVGACGSAGPASSNEGDSIGETSGKGDTVAALSIEENTASRLRGKVTTVDGLLTFSAVTLDARSIALTLVVNGKAFDAKVDDVTTSIDGHDAILATADRHLLTSFIDQFEMRFAGMTVLSRDASLNSVALYLSEAPEGHVHRSLTTHAPTLEPGGTAGLIAAGESVTCLKKGTTVTAQYTSSSGVALSEDIVVGSKLPALNGGSGDYSCMGKCGAGCTDYWFVRTGYTKDCLNHDACSRHFSSTKGSRDPNCGDEYNAASYDFTHSSSCTGN